jgi:queuosine precursor transporter
MADAPHIGFSTFARSAVAQRSQPLSRPGATRPCVFELALGKVNHSMRWLPFLGYLASILLANWLVANVAPIVVWPLPELRAPAGVLAAGFVFSFRNLTQETLGRQFSVLAILIGAALSWFVSGDVELGGPLRLPLASGVAFLLSEALDYAVYTPIRRRGWVRAMVASDLAGQVLDSVVFLTTAFGTGGLAFLAGQIVGKAWCTWATAGVMVLVRRTMPGWSPVRSR